MMKIGLAGCGVWGKKIAEICIRLGVELSVFDVDPFAMKFLPESVVTHRSFDRFIANACDGYIVATPASSHLTLIQRLIPQWKPLFVEKPLVITADEAIAVREFKDREIYAMHIWKHHPGIIALSDFINGGFVGDVLSAKSLRCNWTSPRRDLDSIWNLVPHDLSICDSLFGKILKPRFAIAEVHDGMARGMTAILGQHPYFQFDVSNRHWYKMREIRVHGTQGIAILKDENADHIEVYFGNDKVKAKEVKKELISFEAAPSALEAELLSFFDFLRGGPPPPTDILEALKVTDTIIELRTLAELD